ncbi:MAG: hypothetical protein J6O49_21375, partial [Bacteroidaceae bacterium]|nr:hypothetical protein [Bacteroidaceae bacterium]
MRDFEDIIKDYSKGVPFSKLEIGELITVVSFSNILERANKYGVKFEDFETSEYEVRNYLYDLHQMREDYNIIKDDMRKEGDLMLLFNIIVSSIICYLVYEITHYISFALWIVVIIFTYL